MSMLSGRKRFASAWFKRVAMLPILFPAALSGCPVPPDNQTPIPPQHRVDPVSHRGYWIYVPSNYDASRPWPLIVTCHGTPPWDVAESNVLEMKGLAENSGCIVVAPELDGTDGIFGDGPVAAMCRNEYYILSLLSHLGYKYNIDRANVMITGFSGGGFPTYWIGLRHPEIFSTLVARSCNFSRGNTEGWHPSPVTTGQNVKVYYGQFDPQAIRSQSFSAIEYLQSQGATPTTEEIPSIGHERRPGVAMAFFQEHWRTPMSSFKIGVHDQLKSAR